MLFARLPRRPCPVPGYHPPNRADPSSATARSARGPVAPSRRVVRFGLSRRTVRPPTMIASDLARSAQTSARAVGPVTQALCPLVVAIFPSRVIAYLYTRKRSAGGASVEQRAVDLPAPTPAFVLVRRPRSPSSASSSRTWTRIAASRSARRPRRERRRRGARRRRRRDGPASTRAATAASSPTTEGPWKGSRLR